MNDSCNGTEGRIKELETRETCLLDKLENHNGRQDYVTVATCCYSYCNDYFYFCMFIGKAIIMDIKLLATQFYCSELDYAL